MPSIGSTIQRTPLLPWWSSPSSPMTESSGRAASSSRRISSSLSRSVSVTTSTVLDLVSATRTSPPPRSRTSAAACRATSSARSRSCGRVGRVTTPTPPTVARCARGLGQQVPGQRSCDGRQPAGRGAGRLLAALDGGALDQQVAHQGDEARVDPGRRGPDRREAELGRGRERLGVEVVDDLHVVGDEADRDDHHPGRARPWPAGARWSLTSGSSHGTDGGPDREQ